MQSPTVSDGQGSGQEDGCVSQDASEAVLEVPADAVGRQAFLANRHGLRLSETGLYS